MLLKKDFRAASPFQPMKSPETFCCVLRATKISRKARETHKLFKFELRISDFQHFHWLAGHRLSIHLPAVPNMVKERVSMNNEKSRCFGPE